MKLIKHPPWKLLDNHSKLKITKPISYRFRYALSSRNRRITLYIYRFTLDTQLKIINYKKLNIKNLPRLRGRLWYQQRYSYSEWFNCKLERIEEYSNKLIPTFKEIYADRDFRYNLYFTQGIVDPFGPEANTYIALIKL